jgi:excisionase family DNA binding protein
MANKPALPDVVPLPHDDGDALLTPAQVAALFGVCNKTVRRWARTGRLPTAVCTVGGHRRYRWGDVQAVLATARPHRPW